jgi:quercetin dioxygenase-like cupin family protein
MDKTPAANALPPDDRNRKLSIATPDDPNASHIGIVGDTYTILLSGKDTGGRYCLIDMLVPPGGGPGPHRHDFEEMFSILEGEIELTFRGEKVRAKAGTTVNIPANAPHFFKNNSAGIARLLCLCAPAGQEEFFRALGTPVSSRTSAAPHLSEPEEKAFIERAKALAPEYRTELLGP